MTDSQQTAQNEIKYMKQVDKCLASVGNNDDRRHLIAVANQKASHYVDVDGNNIGDFLIDNAKDNHKLAQKPNANDYHEMIVDEIKAIQGDEKTLLDE